MKYTIPISERLVIIFLFFSGEFLLNPYICGFGGGGFFCQEPVSASSQPNLNLFQWKTLNSRTGSNFWKLCPEQFQYAWCSCRLLSFLHEMTDKSTLNIQNPLLTEICISPAGNSKIEVSKEKCAWILWLWPGTFSSATEVPWSLQTIGRSARLFTKPKWNSWTARNFREI